MTRRNGAKLTNSWVFIKKSYVSPLMRLYALIPLRSKKGGGSLLYVHIKLVRFNLAREACLGRSVFLPVDVTATNRNVPGARNPDTG